MSFEIVSAFNAGHGLMMLQCKQTETVDPILDLAPPTADAADAAADAAAEAVSRGGVAEGG